jgi:hypothetical protein
VANEKSVKGRLAAIERIDRVTALQLLYAQP